MKTIFRTSGRCVAAGWLVAGAAALHVIVRRASGSSGAHRRGAKDAWYQRNVCRYAALVDRRLANHQSLRSGCSKPAKPMALQPWSSPMRASTSAAVADAVARGPQTRHSAPTTAIAQQASSTTTPSSREIIARTLIRTCEGGRDIGRIERDFACAEPAAGPR